MQAIEGYEKEGEYEKENGRIGTSGRSGRSLKGVEVISTRRYAAEPSMISAPRIPASFTLAVDEKGRLLDSGIGSPPFVWFTARREHFRSTMRDPRRFVQPFPKARPPVFKPASVFDAAADRPFLLPREPECSCMS
jgi:hypothetical protein